MKLEFDKKLQQDLISQGYTHILSVGVVEKDTEDYLLLPLKPDDPRLQYEESDLSIEPIDSNDVTDMATGDEFISFYIDMPAS